ncbi:hypothetical protein M514_06015, partial [Trichuris suis]
MKRTVEARSLSHPLYCRTTSEEAEARSRFLTLWNLALERVVLTCTVSSDRPLLLSCSVSPELEPSTTLEPAANGVNK